MLLYPSRPVLDAPDLCQDTNLRADSVPSVCFPLVRAAVSAYAVGGTRVASFGQLMSPPRARQSRAIASCRFGVNGSRIRYRHPDSRRRARRPTPSRIYGPAKPATCTARTFQSWRPLAS